MQFDWNAVYRGQMDLAPETERKTARTVERNQKYRESRLTALTSADSAVELQEEKTETYKASEEGLMKLYLEQVKNAQNKANQERDKRNEELKVIQIAHNIMRGYKVPAQDESFLLTKNYKMYMAAKNLAMMRECKGEAKSVLGNEGTSSGAAQTGSSIAAAEFLVGAGESAIANAGSLSGQKTQDESKSNVAFKNNSFAAYNAYLKNREYNSALGFSRVSQTTKKKTKTRKRFYYNFKDVSSRIVKAKTSGVARQVLASAKQRSAIIRRKMKTGDYDDDALRIALVHAEAMERVAKKKMKHLQEEERCKRGGPCDGDTEREDIEEQMRLDEQNSMEKQSTQSTGGNSAGYTGSQGGSDGLEDSLNDMSLEELMANAMQSNVQMLDLASSMDMFIEDFSSMMKDAMEEMDGLSELAEELMGVRAEPDMDPEDLKKLKLKHRTEEQRKIAEADSKYLRALFQKLQREQQAVAQGAAKIAEAIIGNNSGAMLSLTGSSQSAGSGSGAASAGSSSGGAAAQTATEAPVELIHLSTASTSADVPTVSTDTAVSAVASVSTFDVSV